MSIEALKAELETLPLDERQRLVAYLVALRHRELGEVRCGLAAKIDDDDPDHWVSLEEFEKRLEA